MRAAALAGVLLLAATASAADLPPRVEIRYSISRAGLHLGTATEVLERNGDSYSIVSDAGTAGVAALFVKGGVRRESRGSVTTAGLRPDTYRDERTAREPVEARFDWNERRLVLSRGSLKQELPLAEGTQDRLSLLYTFAFRGAPEGPVDVHMTDGRHLTLYRYEVVGIEHLATPLGNLEALHLAKKSEGGRPDTEVWLSTRYHLLPVRIAIREKDGTMTEQVVTGLELP